jgi:hypothetical protein
MVAGILLVAQLTVASTSAAEPSSKIATAEVVQVTPDAPVAANLHAAATLYRAAMLEEMKLFQVADAIAAKYQAGLLPVDKARGEAVAAYLHGASSRFTEQERQRLYAHVFGAGDDDDTAQANPQFPILLARFLATVEAYRRPAKASAKAKAKANATKVSADEVKTAVRALALDVSNRSYGAPVQAAPLLEAKIDLAKVIVGDALGSKLSKAAGPTVDVDELRRRARAGADLLHWLGTVTSALATHGGAEAEELDTADERVPRAVRHLSRALTPEDIAAAKQPPLATEVVAVCFDEVLHLVPCKVEPEEKSKKSKKSK